jgi:opacity protein-like surface antigen
MSVRVLLAAALALAVANGALADEDFSGTGLQLGMAGLVAIPTDLESGIDLASGGFNARVGYRLVPRFAAELEYEWLSSFSPSFFFTDAKVEPWALTANGRFYLLTSRVQPFLLLGAGILRAERERTSFGGTRSSESTEFAARFGLGVDVYVVGGLAVTFDTSYLLPTGPLEDLDYLAIGLGLQYRF